MLPLEGKVLIMGEAMCVGGDGVYGEFLCLTVNLVVNLKLH